MRNSVHSQVKEIAELLEDQLGLVHGWLMSVPCKVSHENHCTKMRHLHPGAPLWRAIQCQA